MEIAVKPQRVSVAELTPPTNPRMVSAYVAALSKIAYDFHDLNISWGVEAYSTKDFNPKSTKFDLINYLSDRNFPTEVHLNDDALKNLMFAKPINDSEIAQTLVAIANLERTILNLNAKLIESQTLDPMRPTEMSFLHNDKNFKPGKPGHTTVMLCNESTEKYINSAIRANEMAPFMKRNMKDLGLMFCPIAPVQESYKEFRPLMHHTLKDNLIVLNHEYAGALNPGNIYDALTYMAQNGIVAPNIATRGGVMTDGKLDFKRLIAYLNKIQKWQNNKAKDSK